jgi:UDP-N-acetylmuramoyl-tripeptide--D-alanyl-D-alanine ligase
MHLLVKLISLFWFLRTIKFVLFWIYLWQLKEYHIPRFIDHFHTHKGSRSLLNPVSLVKIILFGLILINVRFMWLVLLVYLAETLLFALSIVRKTAKRPKLTSKTALLIGLSFVITGLFLWKALLLQDELALVVSLLVFDIFTPLIISMVVLMVQPFFVMVRMRILKKAELKIDTCKNLTVIGITGSYGKTSTKEFLTTILSSKFKVLSTPEHKNSEMGIAQTILQDLLPEHEIFIVEMGAYQKGGIKLLCDMVKPKIGMVTGVNQQHLATFGTMKNLLSAEGGYELAKALPKNGTIILNGENKYCLDLYKKIYQITDGGLKKKLYTQHKTKVHSDIWTEDITVTKGRILFIAKTQEKGMIHVQVNVHGKQNVENLLGAILAAKELGMSLEEISKACENIQSHQTGMVVTKGIHGITIIDSSYSSNPDGVMADLDYLATFPGKRAVIMPCLIELGKESKEIHHNIGKKIGQICDLAIITTKDRFRDIKEGAAEAGMKTEKVLIQENVQDILIHLGTNLKEGDTILLEGRVPGKLIASLNGK